MSVSPHYSQVNNSAEAAHLAILAFLEGAGQPAVVQPGDEPISLVKDAFSLELTAGRLFLEVWTQERHLSRRITGLLHSKPHCLQLSVERFGKREGVVNLVDLAVARSSVITKKAARQTYRERFRRSLLRQFPGWRIVEVSSEPDLEHSLSPAFPRALLRKGSMAQAAIGCPPEAKDVDAVLTFGLIWLEYLRKREAKSTVIGLAVFVPEGKQRSTCLRLLHLAPEQAEWSAFMYSDKVEDRLDLRDYGNIDTSLPVRAGSPEGMNKWMSKLSSLPHVTMREEQGGRVCWAVRGLDFASWEPGRDLLFGIATKHRGSEFHLPEIEALARELARLRSPDAADRSNPLYLGKPELWLETQTRAAIREIDASLEMEPVYRQAPALVGGERSVLDLLAADHTGRLVVVELKASEDIHLPLQALDYWIRVRWHAARDDFRRSGYFAGRTILPGSPRLILVAPALHFHPTTGIITRYFSTEVSLQVVGVAADWRDQIKVMFRRTRDLRP